MEIQVQKLLNNNMAPSNVAKDLGMPLDLVVEKMKSLGIKGWGRPDLFPYIVARRNVNWSGWLDTDQERLAISRINHDQGEVTMMQGRDEDWSIQYAFPKKGGTRKPYFSAKSE